MLILFKFVASVEQGLQALMLLVFEANVRLRLR